MFKILKNKKDFILINVLRFSMVIIVGMFVFSSYVLATGPTTDTGGTGPTTDTGGVQINTSIENPLRSDIDTIPKFIEAIITAVLYIGVPIVALAIIYTGFLFVSAQGNSEKLTKAKKALLYTLIGAVLLLGAFVIANAIQSTVHEIEKSA